MTTRQPFLLPACVSEHGKLPGSKPVETPGDPIKPEFARRLERAISVRRVPKIAALALEVGVDESSICRWRKGGPITLDNALRLSQALDVSLDWLVAGRGDMDAVAGPADTGRSPEQLDAVLKEIPAHCRPGVARLLLAVARQIDESEANQSSPLCTRCKQSPADLRAGKAN